ncbi:SufD family Fe-S cluster assembly protein [Methanotrichaceae archaeon M04Ac]|uniref:SufD family Fe-S cluster assembly protein n=1 Tax=Candidatus Methanocrinis alkalitolerans TaxID=3033395 RepID=A0ABT5XDY1_9EURY|nr:SufD family Fe-S cluster assembly protein [Candidatus Methanocrinis alkalitolerans]MDF0592925.1 SufD family Fe-S cluster assembly protein [Candidatus Methanocrinis alkalitolerans]
MSRLEEKAKKAKDKVAALGTDIDIDSYEAESEDFGEIEALEMLPDDVQTAALNAGVSFAGESAGDYLQVDQSAVHRSSSEEGVEVMDIGAALREHSYLKDYYWKLVAIDADKYTADVGLHPPAGYFIRAKPGTKTTFPLKTCLFMGGKNKRQRVHNVVIAEEGSDLHIITGCTTPSHAGRGLHLGVSEVYVKKNAHVTFTMVHNWGEEVEVRPRGASLVEAGGSISENYITLTPVKSLQAFPTATLAGEGAVASFNTIMYARRGNIDIGNQTILAAPKTSAESISRVVSTGGEIINRGRMVGKVPEIRAHVECVGLILTEKGRIYSIPELDGWCGGLDMSHEAAVGKISQVELEYLMARGLSTDEATSVIVRGFLDVEIKGLPQALKEEIQKITKLEEIHGGS